MDTTRRGLAATALPLIFLAGTVRGVQAKTAGPLEAAACTPGKTGATSCEAAAGCAHCAALAAKGARR